MPLPQSRPYEALEGIYPGRAGKNWGWSRKNIILTVKFFKNILRKKGFKISNKRE
jgi:hypothetical protein